MVCERTMTSCLRCARCCENTEMLLSKADVERISNRCKFEQREFAYQRAGYLYLRNRGKICVFLNPENRQCIIYQSRPMGCRFYPIIYDPLIRQCVVDKDCSNRENISKELVADRCTDLKKFILLLTKERELRLGR